MQTKRHSLFEAIVNVLVGYGCALAGQLIIFPIFDIDVRVQDNIFIGLFFTVISLIRSYVLRRIFTRRTE